MDSSHSPLSQLSDEPWVLVCRDGSTTHCDQTTESATSDAQAEADTQDSTEGGDSHSHTQPDDRVSTARAVNAWAGQKLPPLWAYAGSEADTPYPEAVGSKYIVFGPPEYHELPIDRLRLQEPRAFDSNTVKVWATRSHNTEDSPEWVLRFGDGYHAKEREPRLSRAPAFSFSKVPAFSRSGYASGRMIVQDRHGSSEQGDEHSYQYTCSVKGTGYSRSGDEESMDLPKTWKRDLLSEGDLLLFTMDPDPSAVSASGHTTLTQKIKSDADTRLDYPFITVKDEIHEGGRRLINDPPINVSRIKGTFHHVGSGSSLSGYGVGLQVTTEITAEHAKHAKQVSRTSRRWRYADGI